MFCRANAWLPSYRCRTEGRYNPAGGRSVVPVTQVTGCYTGSYQRPGPSGPSAFSNCLSINSFKSRAAVGMETLNISAYSFRVIFFMLFNLSRRSFWRGFILYSIAGGGGISRGREGAFSAGGSSGLDTGKGLAGSFFSSFICAGGDFFSVCMIRVLSGGVLDGLSLFSCGGCPDSFLGSMGLIPAFSFEKDGAAGKIPCPPG